uniref:BBE domain-containing protein n=1 Tax=Pseudomonas protegens TaxID=380021 RepID=UPI003906A6FA
PRVWGAGGVRRDTGPAAAGTGVKTAGLSNIFTAVHGGKPKRPAYDGCYINYPDVDMKYTATGAVDPDWLNLYYGWNRELIDRLCNLKAAIDPNNLFRHELSIPTTKAE